MSYSIHFKHCHTDASHESVLPPSSSDCATRPASPARSCRRLLAKSILWCVLVMEAIVSIFVHVMTHTSCMGGSSSRMKITHLPLTYAKISCLALAMRCTRVTCRLRHHPPTPRVGSRIYEEADSDGDHASTSASMSASEKLLLILVHLFTCPLLLA